MTGASVLLVGAGRMGRALLEGWLAKGALDDPPTVLEPAPAPELRALAEAGRIRLNPQEAPAPAPALVVLAVKPQSFPVVLPTIKPRLEATSLILSIAAGQTLAAVRALLGERPIVRAMPNTPAQIGQGITAACASSLVDPAGRARCTSLLEAVGEVVWVDDEALMDAVTAVSGSGPAYLFAFCEGLAAAGVRQGLAPELAARLARQTVVGAAALLARRREGPAALRAEVTSPGGTTEAALDVLLADKGLTALLNAAVAAATARGRALASLS